MNPIDFEKTRIFKGEATSFKNEATRINSKSIFEPKTTPQTTPLPGKPASKPFIKKLSKEETAMLIGGGVLAIGLGAIVIPNMFGDEPDPKPVDPVTSKPSTDKPEIVLDDPIHKTDHPHGHDKPPVTEPVKIDHGPSVHHPITVPEHPPVAHNVSDDQSFEEAFKAARAEVGPGGVFEYHNTTYSTYLAEEWNGMSHGQQEKWASVIPHSESTLDPDIPVEPVVEDQHVVMNTHEHSSWTGIDKNGDGIVDVLISRVEGHAPTVMVDTDQDGQLDTRFDLDPETGHTMASVIDPLHIPVSIVSDLGEIEQGQEFNAPTDAHMYTGEINVNILPSANGYLVGIDTDHDQLVDTIYTHADGEKPIIGLDADGDGHIETEYQYNHDHHFVVAHEQPPLGYLHLDHPEDSNSHLSSDDHDHQEHPNYYPTEETVSHPHGSSDGESFPHDDSSQSHGDPTHDYNSGADSHGHYDNADYHPPHETQSIYDPNFDYNSDSANDFMSHV
jgi:hypothetical protein